MERDKYMTPSEARDFGIIDKILEHPCSEREEQEKSHLTEQSATATT